MLRIYDAVHVAYKCETHYGSEALNLITSFRSVNYGSLGVFVGHEITHAFDNQGNFLCFSAVFCNMCMDLKTFTIGVFSQI